jgi:hypothetical protein
MPVWASVDSYTHLNNEVGDVSGVGGRARHQLVGWDLGQLQWQRVKTGPLPKELCPEQQSNYGYDSPV